MEMDRGGVSIPVQAGDLDCIAPSPLRPLAAAAVGPNIWMEGGSHGEECGGWAGGLEGRSERRVFVFGTPAEEGAPIKRARGGGWSFLARL